MKDFTLIGRYIIAYTDSLSIEGVLELIDDDKLIINNAGEYFLVFKDKVNVLSLNPREKLQPQPEGVQSPAYHEPKGVQPEAPEDKSFAQNGIAEDNQYGSILPRTLIEQQPVDPYESMLDDDSEQDFSVSISTLQNEEALLARAERQKNREKNKRDIDGSTD